MKKTTKILLTGFAVAFLGALSMNLQANAAAETKDCSVVSTDECTKIEMPGGNYMTISGKAKPVTPPPTGTPD